MPLYSFEGRSPTIDPSAFIAPTATLIGDVHVEAGASVWFNAVLRADFAPIIVREGANVQDCCVLHAPPGIPVDVGPGATIAHGCVVHGVHIGAEAVLANHCTVLDGAVIGARSLIAAHSLVVGGTKIPDEVVVTGSPAPVLRPATARYPGPVPPDAGPGNVPEVEMTFSDGTVISSSDGEVHAKLSELAGRDVRLTALPPADDPSLHKLTREERSDTTSPA